MQIDKKKHGTGGNENYLSAEFCWKMNILYIDRYAFYTEKLLAERLTETIFFTWTVGYINIKIFCTLSYTFCFVNAFQITIGGFNIVLLYRYQV